MTHFSFLCSPDNFFSTKIRKRNRNLGFVLVVDFQLLGHLGGTLKSVNITVHPAGADLVQNRLVFTILLFVAASSFVFDQKVSTSCTKVK